MFTITEMTNAFIRMQTSGQLPVFCCILVDREGQFAQPPLNHIAEHDSEELPRVCYDFRKYQFVEPESDKKKAIKKADKENDEKAKKFKKYLKDKFWRHFWDETGLSKKFRNGPWARFYVKDFRVVPVDQIIDTKAKDGTSAEFKGELGLLITMGKGPKK